MSDRFSHLGQAARAAWLAGLVGLALSLFSSAALSQTNPFAPPAVPSGEVTEIRIEGTRRVETNAVRNRLGTRVGQPVTREQIRQDILAIRRLSVGGTPFFEDVVVDVSEGENGIVVTYTLVERPIITSLDYEFVDGDELEDDILDVVDVDEDDIFDLSRLRENVSKIEELYREQGYYLADVDFRYEETPGGDMAVTFIVEEYEEVEVRRVDLIGNEAISDDELRSIMFTRPGELLGFLTGAGVFNESEFANDRRRLRSYYYDQGYVNVDVAEPQVELSRDLSEVYITIPIEEGDRYRVGDVRITGDLLIEEETLRRTLIEVESGDWFSSTAVRRDMERITNRYKARGYANAIVNLGNEADHENRRLDIIYDIQQGELVYIGRITITGNETTRDEVIRREMRIYESDLYDGPAIDRSRARIERLGFFESVQIREIATNDAQIMDLEVEVAERSTGQFQVGAGFSSVESFIATATVAQNNLFGRGQSLALQASISAIRTIFSLSFNEPYFFGTRWQFGFEVFNREVLFTDFTRRALGFSLTLGHPITDDVTVSGTYQLEDVNVEAGGRSGRADRVFSNLFVGGRTSSLTGAVVWDTRNNRLFPSGGWLQRASVELADGFLGSENEFVRLSLTSRWYYELLNRVIVVFNANLGWVATTDPNRPVPIFERFFLGGPNSIRGFERATLSPEDPVADDPNDPQSFLTGFPIGGNKDLFFNLEVGFPILTAIGLRGVLFVDAGNAFAENQSLSLALDVFSDDTFGYTDVLRTAVGFGFRWQSPIGPLRFEWGFPLSPLPNEDVSLFEFSIGNFL